MKTIFSAVHLNFFNNHCETREICSHDATQPVIKSVYRIVHKEMLNTQFVEIDFGLFSPLNDKRVT